MTVSSISGKWLRRSDTGQILIILLFLLIIIIILSLFYHFRNFRDYHSPPVWRKYKNYVNTRLPAVFSQKNPRKPWFLNVSGDLILIEATRFELAASASRTRRSTKLSHASICICYCEPIARSRCYLTSYSQKRQALFYCFSASWSEKVTSTPWGAKWKLLFHFSIFLCVFCTPFAPAFPPVFYALPHFRVSRVFVLQVIFFPEIAGHGFILRAACILI